MLPPLPTRLPENFTVGVRIEGVDDTGLLSGDENVVALHGKQQGGGAEVKVRPARRVVVRAGAAARDVTRGRLPCPDDLAGLEIEGENGVAGLAGGPGIVVASSDVEQAALGIDGRSRPDACARRTILRSAGGIDPGLFRRRDGVGLPEDGAVADAERGDAAAEGAAGILRIVRSRFFPGGGGNEHDAALGDGRAGEPSGVMRIDFVFPEEAPVRRVQAVEPTDLIAEEYEVACSIVDDECRGAHRTIGLEGPIEASSLGIHGVNDPAGAPDKQDPAQNGGCGEGGDVVLEAEGPLELEVAHLAGSQAGSHRGLKASVRGEGLQPVQLAGKLAARENSRLEQKAAGEGPFSAPGTPRNLATASRWLRWSG